MTSDASRSNVESESVEEIQIHPESSVFDFLYHDARRIASFLAQFSDYGHPSSIRTLEATAQTATTRLQGGVSGGIPLVGNAQGNVEQTTADDVRDSAERTFDPLWANAVRLLDFLHSGNLIKRDIRSARIGQFVLLTGGLALVDIGIFKKMWESPHLKSLIVSGIKAQAQTQPPNRKERRRSQYENKEAEIAVEMMGFLPHTAVAAINAGDVDAWCTLREEWLTVPTSDILLKHGASVAGEWSVLGILDALPDPPDEQFEGISARALIQLVSAARASQLAMMLSGLLPATRGLLGRPEGAFGITPLLVFRQISG